MKKNLLPVIVLLFSSAAFAQTDHYFLRDGNHVRHLKISQIKDKMTVTADVDFEPNPDEEDGYPCAAEISGEAKKVAEDVVVLKKHAESAASYCELSIQLTATGAKVAQSEGCGNFVTGICHFATDGKELVKMK